MARGDIIRFDPFSGLESLRRDLFDDRFFRELRRVNLPTTDVYTDDEKGLVVEAHLPRFEEDDITVTIDGGQLIIQAERHEKDEDKKRKYVIRESSSSFYRSITLPEQAEADKAGADFTKGVLTVTVPLKQVEPARKIAIAKGS